MTLTEFVSRHEGQILGYPSGHYVGECLSLVKVYIEKVFNIDPPPSGCNAARCYWSKFPNPLGTVFRKVPNTPDGVPQRGDIVVWDENTGNGFGHIAIVLEADVNGFTSLDQNWNGRHAHKVQHNYNHVYGWLTPKGSMSETITVNKTDWDRLLDASKKGDELINALGITGNIADASQSELNGLYNLKIDNKRYKKERDEAREEVTELTEENAKLAGQLEDCYSEKNKNIPIDQEIVVAGETWVINGVEVDSDGRVTANYRKK